MTTCATCVFSHDLKRKGVVDLQCRRYPLVTGMSINRITQDQTAMVSHAVAMVAKDFWCGEHQLRVAEVIPIVRDESDSIYIHRE